MLDRIKQTLKHSVIYSFGNISTKLVGFILLPIIASHIPINEYGKLAILEASSQFLVAIFGLRIPTAIMRWLADTRDEKERKSIVFSGTSLVMFSMLLLFLAMFFSRDTLAYYLLGSSNFSNYIFILSITVSASIFNQISFQLFRFFERSVPYISITISRLLIVLLLSILFIVKYKLGIVGILYSQMIGALYVSCLSLPMIIKNSRIHFNRKIAGEMFHYSWPLIFSTLSAMLLSIGDKFIIKFYTGFDELGVYSLGYKIASVINILVIQSFQTGYLPIAFKMCNSKESRRFFSKILTYFTFILLVFIMLISFFSKELIMLLADNPAYISAYSIVPIISFLFLTKGIQYVFSIGIHCAKKTKCNFFIVSTGAILNLILNILFIPIWGRFAAAYTSIISGVVISILFYIYAQKYYTIPYELPKIFKMIIVTLSLFFVAFYPLPISLYVNIIKKLILLFLFPIILYFLNFFEPIEILRIKQSWNKWQNPSRWKRNLTKNKHR